ncbi:putative family 17 glucosidase [Saccharomycopsis crataegensis]|uniref:Family 17 glucosidase n=1 Tax=Saccharomycopsis crataegensis TaxID=43959 RepID=A0AAV5QT98_9ASCO|nr:putative family 17 glucosidase [Saccharomycopsis crataegensis]
MLFNKAILLSALSALASAMPSAHHQHKRSDSSSSLAKGIAYTPYTAAGECKTTSEVAEDLKTIADYDIIRLYGTDCNQVSNVLAGKADSQKLFLEVYDPSSIAAEVSVMKSAIESSGSWDDVHTVSIGNELVNSGLATVSQIAEYVATGKTALTAAGYTGPVVSVDTFIAVINNPGLCAHSDYIAVNAHAYFDGGYTAEDAGVWLLNQIQRVWEACEAETGETKDVFISESGWPSAGDTNSKAVPSVANQKAAISSIVENCGNDTIVFSAFNDLWKADGSYNVEKHWGIYSS